MRNIIFRSLLFFSGLLFLGACTASALIAENEELKAGDIDLLTQQVRNAEIAFAQSMADRDIQAFQKLISEEAVFIAGTTQARGRDAIVKDWKKYFEGQEAPFSWSPETVVVLDSGNMALSTGPVLNSSGKLISYYSSTWRQERDGVWRVIFDKGYKACSK